jgi:hypothetical protein
VVELAFGGLEDAAIGQFRWAGLQRGRDLGPNAFLYLDGLILRS